MANEALACELSVSMRNKNGDNHAHDKQDKRDAEQPHQQDLRFALEVAFHGSFLDKCLVAVQ
jgi:hypothetical protein